MVPIPATLPADTYTVTVAGEDTIPVFGTEAQTITVASGATEDDLSVEAVIPDSTITATVFAPGGEDPLPFAAVTCSHIPDGTAERALKLDSIALDIPSNAIPSAGDVTVTVTPTPDDLPQNEENRVLGIPVNVRAFDDNGSVRSTLDQPVDVTLPYSEDEVTDQHALETDLVPKYYNEASGAWEVIDGFTHNPDQHTISFSTEHFTQFALVYNERIAGTAPNKVKNVRARFTEKLRVTWKKVNQAETYDVQLLKKMGKKFKQAKLFTDVTGRSTMIAKKWLKAGKTYRLRVRSVGSNGLYGQWSKPVRWIYQP